MNLMKKLTLASALLMCVGTTATAGTAKLNKFELPYGWVAAMSDNGKWAVCQPPSNEEPDAVVYRLNIETGELEQLALDADQADTKWGNIARCNDVTDDGATIVGEYNRYPAYFSGDKWTELTLPQGYRNWMGEVCYVTPDGKTMVGWMQNGYTLFVPMVWVDKEVRTLTNLPTYEEMHELGIIDDSDLAGHKSKNETTPNIKPFGLSGDGRYILFGADHNYPAWGASRFVYDLENDTYDWIINSEIHGSTFVDEAFMSPDGRTVCGYVVTNDGGNDDKLIPFTYKPETKELTLNRDGQRGQVVDNAGQLYASAGSAPYFALYIPVDGLQVPLDKILSQKYGIDFYAQTGYGQTGYPVAVSNDSKTLLCQGEFRTGAYSVTLPETFAEAARGVNLLTDWAPTPSAGADIARLPGMTVQLSYSADYDETKVPVIKEKSTGEVVATSTGVSPVNTSKNLYRVLFDNVQLEAGKTYTVSIPEAAFFVEGTVFQTPLMEVDYIGREEKPLAGTEISPAPGSAVRELSSNNAVSITFPTNITVNTGVVSYLYVKGNATPMSTLSLTADGKTLSIYPPASRMLNDGTEYQLQIPAGAVTDITGFCPNEAFSIDYSGSYVPDASEAEGSYLFFDDFNNPNQSLSNFLQYEGDHLTPTDEMAAWGFDADNTPWNFSIRDDADYDYCAASHSSYSRAGQSDDWLVLPQLNILSEDCFLTFKGQSYKKAKKDFLRVIVYEDNDRYGSLDKSIVDRMKSEGTEVFNSQLRPGSSETQLADDWQEYEVKLDKWNGKKVYIAFVNSNTDQSALFIDDVAVGYRTDYTVGTVMPTVLVAAENTTVSGFVRSNRAEAFQNLEATYRTAAGHTGTFKAENINLERNATYEFTFDTPLPLELGAETTVEIEVKLDDQLQNFTTSVSNMTRSIVQRVLIEEGTGLWCGNCPQGSLAFDYLEKQLPGTVIPVAIHNDDSMASTRMDIYLQFLQINAFPTARVNRRTELGAPMYGPSFVSENGGETWMELVLKEIENPASVEIKATEANYCDDLEGILIPFEVEFALNRQGVHYNVFAILTEDGIQGAQTNYFASATEDIYGVWGAKGEYGLATGADGKVDVICNHVARGWSGTSFYGISGKVPETVKAGEKYGNYVIVKNLGDTEELSNCSVVLALIDAGTGKVINSDVIKTIGHKDDSGVKGIGAESAKVSIKAVGGSVLANGSAAGVEVYTIEGVRVANSGLNGLYIVRAQGRTLKMIVK